MLTKEEQRDADLLIKWNDQGLEKKNLVPTKDILIRMWDNLKPQDLVTTLPHRTIGSLSDKPERIKNSFINLYQTLSNVVHNCGVNYEEDSLPIPDLNKNTFNKTDALALATFYSVNLLNMTYAIVSILADLPSSFSYWINNDDLNNSSNTSTTTYPAQNENQKKRKLSDGNEENEFESTMT